MSVKVNFIGKALIGEIIRSMDVGKQYYACEDAIVVTVDGFGYINLGGQVMDVKDENFTIPIKRTSLDSYQVDVSIDWVFVPVVANDELSADKTKDLIGPFKVDIVQYSDLEYYKRMPLEELQTDLEYWEKYFPSEEMNRITDIKVAIDMKKMQ